MRVVTSSVVAAVIVVVVAGVTGWSSAASACEFSQDAKVVGFNAAATQAVLRIEFANLTISIVDLKSDKIVETFEILSNEERQSEGNAKLRAQRWKAVEAKLVKRGFKIVPDLAPLKNELKPGIQLVGGTVQSDAEELSGWWGPTLAAKRGAEEVMLLEGSIAPPSDAGGFGPVYLSPGGKYLITSDSGCSHGIHVVDVENIDAQLTPASATPAAPAKPTTTGGDAKPR